MANKRILCVVTLVIMSVLIINSSYIQVAAEEHTYEDAISEIMEENRILYLQDPEFYREAEETGLSFEELLRQKAISTYQTRINLEMYGGISMYGLGNNGQNLSANVPLIQQTSKSNCGPTSALQALYAVGDQGEVPGQTNEEKINRLMCDSGTDDSGTYVYRLTDTLNKYTRFVDYAYIEGRSMTEEQFQARVESSLLYDVAPIVHARTEYLSYYKGHESGHYIAIREVDKTNKTIRLMDCNKNNEYYGDHVVPVTEVYKSISEKSSRYLISLTR